MKNSVLVVCYTSLVKTREQSDAWYSGKNVVFHGLSDAGLISPEPLPISPVFVQIDPVSEEIHSKTFSGVVQYRL